MATRFFPSYNGNEITSRFGMRTLNGTTKMHNGIDLVAKKDNGGSATDHITAHTGGTVQAVGYSASAGYYINISVGANSLMVYYHLKALPTQKKGAVVKTGEIIGYMGSTGNSTGAHLHFGIKRNGKWIDPEPYLDKDYTETEEAKTVTITLSVLRKGATGAQVETLQRLLHSMGYDLGDKPFDGIFGSKTEEAVKAYQKANDLEDDGVVGKLTWSKLMGV